MERKKHIRRIKRLVVKIGSGIVINSKGVNASFLKALATVVAQLRTSKVEVVVVSSGAIACGMGLVGLHRRPHLVAQKQAVAALGQPLLIQYYIRAFAKHGISVSQILLTRDDLENKHRFLTAKHALKELFRLKSVPVVNENDSVAVEEIKFGDNDQLSAMVAHLVEADLLVILTDTDGLHDRDPKRYHDAQRISVVPKVDKKAMGMAMDTLSAKSTGGMITKLKAAKMATRFGIPTLITRGNDPRIILEAIKGCDVGTLFLPSSGSRR